MASISTAIKKGFYNTFYLKDKRIIAPIIVFFLIGVASSVIGVYTQDSFFMQPNTSYNPMAMAYSYNYVGLILPLYILLGLVGLFFFGFIVVSYSSKRSKSSMSVIKETASHYLSLLATTILMGVILIAGFIAFVLPGIFLSIKLVLSQMFVLLKKDSPGKALSDSYEITKGKFWDIFALLLVIWFIVVFFEFVVLHIMLLQPIYAFTIVVNALVGAFFTVAIISTITDYFLQVAKKIKV
ncbi:MAG: hypothetical protein M1433_01345 [Candidatus Parvarchaeota archaeon]|nr:hypothetical protein [Candidatus Parvarchaeota archaeon]